MHKFLKKIEEGTMENCDTCMHLIPIDGIDRLHCSVLINDEVDKDIEEYGADNVVCDKYGEIKETN